MPPNYLEAAWQQLARVQHFTLVCGGLHGEGSVVRKGHDTYVFMESGRWCNGVEQLDRFQNTTYWTRDIKRNTLSVQTDRVESPLATFTAGPETTWHSSHPHICGADTYVGAVTWHEASVQLEWRVSGPAKNLHIVITYQY